MRDDFAKLDIAVCANGRTEQRVTCPRGAKGEIAISGELAVKRYTTIYAKLVVLMNSLNSIYANLVVLGSVLELRRVGG